MRSNEKTCSGPIAQVCNHCWRQKKSCLNGGTSYFICFRSANLTHHITYRSPRSGRFSQRVTGPLYDKEAESTVYSTMDADAIGQMDTIDVYMDPPQAIG